MNIFLKIEIKYTIKNIWNLFLKQVRKFIVNLWGEIFQIDTIFIVQNMKYNLNNQINFGLQLVSYITLVSVLQLFKIDRFNCYFVFLKYKHKFCKTS